MIAVQEALEDPFSLETLETLREQVRRNAS
jgi:hypothetical protein